MKRFLTGLATGLAIGYLTAPRTGKDTRDQLTKAADKQTKGLKEQWEKAVSQGKKLVDEVKSSMGTSKPETNLFAVMESGKMDKYMDETDIARRKAREGYNDKMDNTADAAKATINKAEEALKQ